MAKGIHNVDRFLDAARGVPPAARPALDMLAGQLRDGQARIEEVTARIGEMRIEDELVASQRFYKCCQLEHCAFDLNRS